MIEEILKKLKSMRKIFINYFNWCISKKVFATNLCPSGFYKKPKEGNKHYKRDRIREKVTAIFDENKQIYGSGRIAAILSKSIINILMIKNLDIAWLGGI